MAGVQAVFFTLFSQTGKDDQALLLGQPLERLRHGSCNRLCVKGGGVAGTVTGDVQLGKADNVSPLLGGGIYECGRTLQVGFHLPQRAVLNNKGDSDVVHNSMFEVRF